MSILIITKISNTGEKCWGIELFNDKGMPLLKCEQGVSKGEINSIAKALKFVGSGAPIVLDDVGKPEGPAWVLEKSEQGWSVRFTPAGAIKFGLVLKSVETAGSFQEAEEALKDVQKCLSDASIQWDPVEADPAYKEKIDDETEIQGIPGSGPQLSETMQEKLNEFTKWAFKQVRVLENPVLMIFDYSPTLDQRPLSIAFDYGGGAKCWMTTSDVRKIDNDSPKYHPDYKEFCWEERRFKPFSIKCLPKSIFEDIVILKATCCRLYHHVVWK